MHRRYVLWESQRQRLDISPKQPHAGIQELEKDPIYKQVVPIMEKEKMELTKKSPCSNRPKNLTEKRIN